MLWLLKAYNSGSASSSSITMTDKENFSVMVLFGSHEKCEYVNYLCQAGWPAGCVSSCGKNFNVAIFLDTINMVNVKLGRMVVLIEHYPSISLSVNLVIYFKVTAVSNNFNWKFYVLIWLSWNFVWLLTVLIRLWIYHYFFVLFFGCTCSREINDIFPRLEKNFNIGFFSDTIQARLYKFCLILT